MFRSKIQINASFIPETTTDKTKLTDLVKLTKKVSSFGTYFPSFIKRLLQSPLFTDFIIIILAKTLEEMSIFLNSKIEFRFLFLSFFMSFCIPAFGQAPIEWVQSVGDTCNQGFNGIIGTSDGGVILTGYEYSGNQADALFSKLDENGTIEWSKTFGGSNDDIGYGIVESTDGGFVMAGTSTSNDGIPASNNGDCDAWIMKVNSAGALQWSHTYGGCGFDDIASINKTSDGGFIVAGTTTSPTNNIITENAGKKDALILKLDSNGNLTWSRTFGGSQNDIATAIQQTPNGGYIFSGTTWSDDIDIPNNGGFSDMWLVKLLPDGNLQWSKTFGGMGEEHANDLDLTSDGGFLLAGSSSYLAQSGTSNSVHRVDFAVTKVNASGTMVWSNVYGGTEMEKAYGGIEASTGEYIISGYSSSADGNVGNNFGFKDFWVLSLNSSGGMNWSKNYGGSQNDFSTAVTETQDGGLAFAGYTWSNDNDVTTQGGIDDGWVLKLEGAGLPPTIDLGIDQSVCIGNQITISATTSNCTGCTYLWNDGYTNANRLLEPTASTSYSVTATNNIGQTATDEINITVNPLPTVSSFINNPPCNNAAIGSIDLTPTSPNMPFTYLWNNGQTTEDLNNISAGTYSVTFTDTNNCSDEVTFILSNPSSFIVNSTTYLIDCNGDNDGLIDLQISGGTGPFDFLWSNGATTEDIANLAPGSYSVTIEDANLCQEIQSFNVTEPTALQNNPSSTNIDCSGNNNGHINLNVSGGNAPYSYIWSNGQTGNSLSNLTAGDYIVTITDNVECQIIETFSISTPTQLIGSIDASQIPCFSSSNGSVDLMVAGGTPPYSFIWSNGATTEDINNLTAGTYSVVITDNNNCTTSEQVTIEMTNELVINDITNAVSCNGDADGSIDISVTGGNGNYSYQWSNGLTSEDLSNLTPGTYDVIVVDVSNCEGSASFVISEPDPISILHSTFSESCLNSNDAFIDLNISGGSGDYTYLWSNQSTSENLSNISAGNYFVTVTDSNNCTMTESFQVMTNPAPQVESAVFDASCFGLIDGEIDLSISPTNNQYAYTWSNGPTTEDLQNLSAGNYIVTISYGNNCEVIEDFTIQQPLAITISGDIVNLECHGEQNGSINLSVSGGSNVGFQYNWNNGNTNEDLSNLNGGIYSVEITDSNNCSESASFEVMEPMLISLNGILTNPTSSTASDGAIQLFPNGGITPYTVNWSNGDNSFNPSNLSAGTYSVTLTDANDCIAEETFTLTGPVGTNDIEALTNFTLFPNPTTVSFNVNASFNSKIQGEIVITNLLGQTLDQYSFFNATIKKEFDVQQYPSGIYLVTLHTSDGQLTEKLVVD